MSPPSQEDRVALNRLSLMLNEFRKLDPEIPVQQLSTFLAVAMEPGITVTDAGTKAGVGLGSVSRHIDVLGKPRTTAAGRTVGLSLLVATPDPVDRRRKTVALTAKGQRIADTLLDLLKR